LPHESGFRIRRRRQWRHALGIGGDEFCFALICAIEQFLIGQTTDETWMHDAGPANARYMPRGRIDAVEIPTGLSGLRIMIDEETAAILARKNAGEAPRRCRQIADIEEIDDQQIARLRAFTTERPAKIMNLGEIDIAHIVCAVIVFDLAAGPVKTFDPEFFS